MWLCGFLLQQCGQGPCFSVFRSLRGPETLAQKNTVRAGCVAQAVHRQKHLIVVTEMLHANPAGIRDTLQAIGYMERSAHTLGGSMGIVLDSLSCLHGALRYICIRRHWEFKLASVVDGSLRAKSRTTDDAHNFILLHIGRCDGMRWHGH